MTRIGLISDTHSYLDPSVFHHFQTCDEIWHAGDIGNEHILQQLSDFKPTRAVYGNIDSNELRWSLPENAIFELEGFRILITHIAGKPSHYTTRVKKLVTEHTPNLLICGHSHILRVIKDPSYPDLLYINPGAAGRVGFHSIRTLIRFELNQKKIHNLEVINLVN